MHSPYKHHSYSVMTGGYCELTLLIDFSWFTFYYFPSNKFSCTLCIAHTITHRLVPERATWSTLYRSKIRLIEVWLITPSPIWCTVVMWSVFVIQQGIYQKLVCFILIGEQYLLQVCSLWLIYLTKAKYMRSSLYIILQQKPRWGRIRIDGRWWLQATCSDF